MRAPRAALSSLAILTLSACALTGGTATAPTGAPGSAPAGTTAAPAPVGSPAPAAATVTPGPVDPSDPAGAEQPGRSPLQIAPLPPSASRRLALVDTVRGDINPKSVVASDTGRIIAQNMMYRHSVTVYDRDRRLVATVPDEVNLADLGLDLPPGRYRGAPVEAAFTPDGSAAYVSNYSMSGPTFGLEGKDACSPSSGYDDSTVFRLDMASLRVDQAIRVGAVPKYVAVTPDGGAVLVSNWCSYDLRVIDVAAGRVVRIVPLGPYPRGIAATDDTAYVAVMGSTKIAVVDLRPGRGVGTGMGSGTGSDIETVRWIEGVGRGPRHLVLDPGGRYLYATLNGEGSVVKIDLRSGRVVDRVRTGSQPRSMDIAEDGQSLYVVNYASDTVSKVRTSDLAVLQTIDTGHHPIGVSYDDGSGELWVACYSGSLSVFRDA